MNSTHFGKTALTILSLIAALLFSMIAVSCGDEGGGETPLPKPSPDTPTPDNPTPSTDIYLTKLIVPKDSNSSLRLDDDVYVNVDDDNNTVTLNLPKNVDEATYQNAKRQLTFNYQVFPSDVTLTFNGKNGNSGTVSNVDLQNPNIDGSDYNIIIKQGSKTRTYKVEVKEGSPTPVQSVALENLTIISPLDSDAKIDEETSTITLLFLDSDTYDADIKKVTFGWYWTKPIGADLYFNGTKIETNTTTVDCSVPSSKIEIRSGSRTRTYNVQIQKVAVDKTEYKIIIDTTNNDEYIAAAPSPITFTKQKGATLPKLSVTGYAFEGYNTKKDGTGEWFRARNGNAYSDEGEYFTGIELSLNVPEVSTELTLYAQWEGQYVQYTINTLFWYVPPKENSKEKEELNSLCIKRKVQLIGDGGPDQYRDGTRSFKAGTTPTLDDIISKWGSREIDYIHLFDTGKQDSTYVVSIKLSDYQNYILTPGTGTANYITYEDAGEQKTLVAPAIPKVTGDGKAEFRLYVLGAEVDFENNFKGTSNKLTWDGLELTYKRGSSQ